ncbi:MAG: type IV secretion system protein [Desulfobacula sp.]|jgi:type IV secretory pathway TrbF-like protein|nr:type IV secretion system protein [Desulfobacula sp.]
MKTKEKTNEKIIDDNYKQIDKDTIRVHRYWKLISIILVILLVGAIGYIKEQSVKKIPEPIVKYHLAKFITNMRSISSDHVMVRKNLECAYTFTSRKGKKQLDKIINDVNLNDKLEQKILVSVQISSIKQKHKTLYTVTWVETEYLNSKVLSAANFEGFFRLEFLPVKLSDNSYLMNPAGIFINNIVINKISKPKLDS